jgi:cell pole-organizing protein PopZ
MTETSPPAATPDGADPSMEDILASIRRILNEEESPADAAVPDDGAIEDDVLVLDESMMVSTPEPWPEEPESEPELEPPVAQAESSVAALRPTATEPEPPNKSTVAPTSRQADPSGSSAQLSDLMAPETAAAATSLVGGLVRSLTAGRNLQVYSRGPTLEDLVRAELRPLLKEWLDANLPPIVERLVRTEIERVVGRAVP